MPLHIVLQTLEGSVLVVFTCIYEFIVVLIQGFGSGTTLTMSHRKFERPRHGSLGFLPRKRTKRLGRNLKSDLKIRQMLVACVFFFS